MKQLSILFALVLLISCNGKSVYSEIDKSFDDNRWQKSDIKVYEFEIGQDATPYEIEVFFSHVYDFQFAKIPLIAEVTYPDSSFESVQFDLILKDDSGSELGDCTGDYCDLSQKTVLPKPLSPGKYKVRLMHNFPGEYVPNVLALGLKVRQLAD